MMLYSALLSTYLLPTAKNNNNVKYEAYNMFVLVIYCQNVISSSALIKFALYVWLNELYFETGAALVTLVPCRFWQSPIDVHLSEAMESHAFLILLSCYYLSRVLVSSNYSLLHLSSDLIIFVCKFWFRTNLLLWLLPGIDWLKRLGWSPVGSCRLYISVVILTMGLFGLILCQ